MDISASALEAQIKLAQNKRSLARAILRLGAGDPRLRSGLFAFLDVLPTLQDSREVAAYFDMYVGGSLNALPSWVRFLLTYAKRNGFLNAVRGYIISKAVRDVLAPYFIVSGEQNLVALVQKYRREKTAVVIDVLGELVLSQSEADAYLENYHNLLDFPPVDGEELHLAVKLSSLCPFFGVQNYTHSVQNGTARLCEIAAHAKEKGAHITVDAEHYELAEITDEIFLNVATRDDFKDWPNLGIALQAYRKDAAQVAARIAFTATKLRRAPITVRLIKGAYWDTEVLISQQNGWPFPLYTEKAETDANFLFVASRLMDFKGSVFVAFGTHNPESIAGVLELLNQKRFESFEFQTLYGLGDPVRRALIARNLPVRVYVPFGDLTSGMAYFARRVLENTANEGFMLKLLIGEQGGKRASSRI